MTFNAYDRRVRDEMSAVVITASPDDSVLEALVEMERHSVNVLPLVDEEDRCVGVFSTTDLTLLTKEMKQQLDDLDQVSELSRQWLIEKIVEHGLSNRPLREVTTRRILTVGLDVPVADAGREMLLRRVHHLVIIDEQQRLQGIVSSLDLLAAFVKGAQ